MKFKKGDIISEYGNHYGIVKNHSGDFRIEYSSGSWNIKWGLDIKLVTDIFRELQPMERFILFLKKRFK